MPKEISTKFDTAAKVKKISRRSKIVNRKQETGGRISFVLVLGAAIFEKKFEAARRSPRIFFL